jgi:hypothetical protein
MDGIQSDKLPISALPAILYTGSLDVPLIAMVWIRLGLATPPAQRVANLDGDAHSVGLEDLLGAGVITRCKSVLASTSTVASFIAHLHNVVAFADPKRIPSQSCSSCSCSYWRKAALLISGIASQLVCVWPFSHSRRELGGEGVWQGACIRSGPMAVRF